MSLTAKPSNCAIEVQLGFGTPMIARRQLEMHQSWVTGLAEVALSSRCRQRVRQVRGCMAYAAMARSASGVWGANFSGEISFCEYLLQSLNVAVSVFAETARSFFASRVLSTART